MNWVKEDRIPATGNLGRGVWQRTDPTSSSIYKASRRYYVINHQFGRILPAVIAVNVFPWRANNVGFRSQFFRCDYAFRKKFQVFSLRIGKPGASLGAIVMQST
ncbi:hypothetical protein, partial [Aeromonas dhakensis]|uniref:hypothetical protein n=1 Tax=Aeromonas dhakensis TaxID=196024 RepID=UPI003B9F20AC